MKRGSITVFLCLLLTIFLGFAGSLLELTRIHLSEDLAEEVLYFGEDELLTHYYLPLYERYHLFGLIWDEEMMSKRLEETVSTCFAESDHFSVFGLQPSARVDHPVFMSEYDGSLYKKQAIGYQKYHVVTGKLKLPETEAIREQQEVMEVLAARTELSAYELEANAEVLSFISLVEGLKTSKAGLVQKKGKYQTEPVFIKMFCPAEPTKANTGVENETIFQALKERYINLSETLESLTSEESSDYEVVKLARSIGENAKKAEEKLQKARKCLTTLKEKERELSKERELYREELAAHQSSLQEEVYRALLEDAKDQPLSSVLGELSVWERGLNEIERILFTLSNWAGKVDADTIRTSATRLSETLSAYHINGLKFQYDHLTQSEGDTKDVWDTVKETFQKGEQTLFFGSVELSEQTMLGIKSKGVSGKNLILRLAERFREESYSFSDAAQDLLEEYLLQNYAAQHMPSFRSPAENELICYQMEYLLSGHDVDQENLLKAAEKIFLSRLIVNLTAVMSDAGMREKAELLARSTVGLTGLEPLVQTAKFLVMLAWAAEESTVEVRALTSGKEVPVWKQGAEFQITFEDLFQFSEALVTEKANRMGSVAGIDYDGYLTAFFWLQDEAVTLDRMMTLTEANIAYLYQVPFQWTSCAVGFRGHILVEPRARSMFAMPGTDLIFRPIEASRDYGFR